MTGGEPRLRELSASRMPDTAESGRVSPRLGPEWARVTAVLCLSALLASAASHAIGAWLGVGQGPPVYRRIGPRDGPQVFAAGSSLLQFGLSWSEVSAHLGRGIESWGVPASSPDMWEIPQRAASNTDLLLIGVSVYDLNEYRVAASRASLVPLSQTIRDLRESAADLTLARRLLNQYLLASVRLLIPTAGYSDKVHVGLRAQARRALGLRSAMVDAETALVLPAGAVLEFGESTQRVSDWDSARLLRRMSSMRLENGGKHAFDGPKHAAFRRMLVRAKAQGDVIIVVLPVTSVYEEELLTPTTSQEFETALHDAQSQAPASIVIRLDHVAGLKSSDYFSDLVHLNSAGRRIATAAFLDALANSGVVSAASLPAHARAEGGR